MATVNKSGLSHLKAQAGKDLPPSSHDCQNLIPGRRSEREGQCLAGFASSFMPHALLHLDSACGSLQGSLIYGSQQGERQ